MYVSTNGDGLGNRIKCLVSAKLKDRDAKLFWPKNLSMDCDYSSLLVDDGRHVSIIPGTHEIIDNWRLSGFPEELLPEGFAIYEGHPIDKGRTIDFEYNRIPAAIRELILPKFLELTPAPEVARQIDRTGSKFRPNTISVHIRSWADAPKRAYNYSIKNYFDEMDKYVDSSFFLACDSEMELEKYKSRYGDRIIVHDLTPHERKTLNPYQIAMAEMYLLSKNRMIIASYASTFSEVAWWLGGASADVYVVPLKGKKIKIDEVNHASYFFHKLFSRILKSIGIVK